MYHRLQKNEWLKLREEIRPAYTQPLSRRSFLRKAFADLADARLDKNKDQAPQQKDEIPPGKLLPSTKRRDMHFCFPEIEASLCNACHACVRLCPHDAIILKETKTTSAYKIAPEHCTGCGLCVDSCDQSAIHLQHWKKAGDLSVPLTQNTCNACGAIFYLPAISSPDTGTPLCAICSKTNHARNLYQVFNPDVS